MASNEHLTDEQAMDLAAGRLSASDTKAFAAHLSDCRQCTQAVTFWQRTVEAAAQQHTVEPPESAVRRAIALFDPALLPAPLWKRLIASLTFDSRQQTALAGVRDAGASFQLLADAGGVEIDLLCEPEAQGWRITGQALGLTDAASASARLTGAAAMEGALNDEGEFVFYSVPAGEVTLEIEMGELTIALEPFTLGGQGD